MGAEQITFHFPTAIAGPLITAAIISVVSSYWWLIRKSIQLSGIVKDLQNSQNKLADKVDQIAEQTK
jgi:outer membrane murein-binding lipoprotein Lpp